ncbi:MAG: hypothetical protein COA36_16335 [Desulfotalea sp.]|nr:MAG: hypothetical protein COA36_16335 [Desulfotalea sp.]
MAQKDNTRSTGYRFDTEAGSEHANIALPLATSSNPNIYNANFTDLPIDLASFFRALWRRKFFILVTWAILQGLAIYSAYTATPIYQSNAALELKILPALPKSELHSEASMSKINEKKYMEAMKRLLSSRKLALMVIETLGLHREPSSDPSNSSTNNAAQQQTAGADKSEADLIKAYVALFQSDFSASIEKGGVTGVINLTFNDESAEKATDILTTLIDQFWLIIYERPEIAFAKERKHIKSMIDQAQIKLNGAYNELNTFLSGNDIFFLENIDVMTKKDIEITSSQLLELSKQTEQTSMATIHLGIIWHKALEDPNGVKEITNNYLISALKEELALTKAELANLAVIYAEGYSTRKATAAKVASLEQAIVEEKNNIIATLRNNFEASRTKEAVLLIEVEKLKDFVIQKKTLKGKYDAIEAEIEINRKVYKSVLQQYEALKIETLFPFTLNMIDPPLLPHRPIQPQKEIRVGIGFMLGIIFGCSIALLIEFTNPGLRAPIEAERRTGLPLLGAVPPMALIKEISSMTQFEKHTFLEGWPEFNQSFNDSVGILLSKPGLSVTITSPEAKEGKAMVALGISRQLITAGKKVLLIDANFSNSKLDKIFNLDHQPGLLDILQQRVEDTQQNHSINQQTPVQESGSGGKLYALKTGSTRNKSTPLGLIETKSFVELMKLYKSETDYVIVITPPLLREVVTYILSRATDTTMMVLRERQSKIKDAVRATEVLHRVGIPIMGLIVTESDSYNK